MRLTKIVITGGPCAGKTTAMSWIQNAFMAKGYTVLFVPETATEFITGGVAPWTCGTNRDYQWVQMALQLKKEELFERAARTMPVEKILLVCDRGALDNKAYMTQPEFDSILRDMGLNEVLLRDSYDAVFHLVTAAKGAQEFYGTETNAIRYESVEQAQKMDDAIIASWTGHPHLRVIDNNTDFQVKLEKLLAEISAFLGESSSTKVTRKFLIRYPDLNLLEAMPNCSRVEIIQTYLRSEGENTIRLRQRGKDGNYIYTRIAKRSMNGQPTIEVESRLSQGEYLRQLMDADTAMRQIRKTRYCMTYNNQSFEIDIFPFWDHQALCHIDLSEEDKEVRFPPEISVIREVTGDPQYKNSSLARNYMV